MAAEKMVRVSSKGQIVLPKRLREKMGIHEGDYLVVSESSDGRVVLGKSKLAMFDELVEPLRQEVEAQGFTREELMETIKDIRKRKNKDAA